MKIISLKRILLESKTREESAIDYLKKNHFLLEEM